MFSKRTRATSVGDDKRRPYGELVMDSPKNDRETMAEVLKPRGLNKRRGPHGRTDGWVGGRADTWHGHYTENPASRARGRPPNGG